MRTRKHLQELQDNDVRLATNETLLWKHHTQQFAEWVKNKVCTTSLSVHFSIHIAHTVLHPC